MHQLQIRVHLIQHATVQGTYISAHSHMLPMATGTQGNLQLSHRYLAVCRTSELELHVMHKDHVCVRPLVALGVGDQWDRLQPTLYRVMFPSQSYGPVYKSTDAHCKAAACVHAWAMLMQAEQVDVLQ